AEQLLDRILPDEAVAAVEVDRERRDPLRGFRRIDLAHRGFREERLSRVPEPRAVVDEQTRRLEIGRGARELVLHRLEVRDRFPELLALLRVAERVVERALRQPDHLRADADAPLVQRLDGDLVALADLAEDVRARHAAVVEDQLARAARADAEL